MEDFRAASEFEQDDWAEPIEYVDAATNWAKMFMNNFPPPDKEVVVWFDPVFSKILWRPYERN